MLLKLLAGFVVLLALLAIVISLRPTDFRVSRSATIAAPPGAVFPQVNDLRLWNGWSPWVKMDPQAKYTYEGPSAGVGARNSWDGAKAGAGTMTITESDPEKRIALRLDFRRPFVGTNLAEFTLVPDGQGTVVTWTMTGQNGFMAKAIGLFMDCEKMCGDQFSQGLASMKAIVESSQAPGELLTMQPQH